MTDRIVKSLTAVKRNTAGLLKGGPGRKPGVPNRVTAEAREACSKLVDDPVYLVNLRKRLLSGRLAPAVETMIWHYAKGKPKESVDVNMAAQIAFTLNLSDSDSDV